MRSKPKWKYGFKDTYAGVPVIIGKGGVEKIIEIKLSDSEKNSFAHSVKSVNYLKLQKN